MRIAHGGLIHIRWPKCHWRATHTNGGHINRARPAHIDGRGDIGTLWIKYNRKRRGGNIIAVVWQRLMKVLLLNNPKSLA